MRWLTGSIRGIKYGTAAQRSMSKRLNWVSIKKEMQACEDFFSGTSKLMILRFYYEMEEDEYGECEHAPLLLLYTKIELQYFAHFL